MMFEKFLSGSAKLTEDQAQKVYECLWDEANAIPDVCHQTLPLPHQPAQTDETRLGSHNLTLQLHELFVPPHWTLSYAMPITASMENARNPSWSRVSTSCLPNKRLFLTQCSPLQGFKFKKCSAWSFARVWQTQKPRGAGCFQIALGMSCDQTQIPSSSVQFLALCLWAPSLPSMHL